MRSFSNASRSFLMLIIVVHIYLKNKHLLTGRTECRVEDLQSGSHQCVALDLHLDPLCHLCDNWALWKPGAPNPSGNTDPVVHSKNGKHLQSNHVCPQPSQVQRSFGTKVSLSGCKRYCTKKITVHCCTLRWL